MKIFLTIVVPCLNEEHNLKNTIESIRHSLQDQFIKHEIIIVDDGSSDSTYALALDISNNCSDIYVVKNLKNMGLGYCYKEGLKIARGNFYMLIPGDNAWDSSEITKIVSLINRADIVIPYILQADDKGLFRKMLSKLFTNIINVLFGYKIPYYNGIVIHKIEFLKKIAIKSNSFAYQVECLLKAMHYNHSFITVGTNTSHRANGKSKALHISNIFKVIFSILGLFISLKICKKVYDK